MKKLIALIVTVCVMLGMCTTAFAATTPQEPAGDAITLNQDGSFTVDGTKVTLAGSESIANNTQTTIVVVEGTAINTNSIQYINQGEDTSFTFVPKDDATYKSGDETVTLTAYIGGDKITRAEAGTITYAAAGGEDTEYTYDVALQNVTYNGIAATVARITGLNPAEVAVTVDGTVAKYYVRTTDSANVIVACIAGTYTDVDAVKALVSIADGTTDAILYGNANSDTSVNSNDLAIFASSLANETVTGRNGTVTYALPTDLTSLHLLDINGDNSVNSNDLAIFASSLANETVSGRNGTVTYSLDTMACLAK